MILSSIEAVASIRNLDHSNLNFANLKECGFILAKKMVFIGHSSIFNFGQSFLCTDGLGDSNSIMCGGCSSH